MSFEHAVEREMERFYEALDAAADANGLSDVEALAQAHELLGDNVADGWREWIECGVANGAERRETQS